MPAFRHEMRVRYAECDPQGIVFNAHYLAFFDVAFTELWRARIGAWDTMTEQGYDAVVAEASLRFRRPARFDDVIALELTVQELGRSSLRTSVDVLRGDELLVEGELRHVVVSTDSWRPAEIPEFIRSGLEPYGPD